MVLIRKEMRRSQQDMAALCGLDDGSWSNWERGSMPRDLASVVAKIAEATGYDRDWLMWGGDMERYTEDAVQGLLFQPDAVETKRRRRHLRLLPLT